MSEVTVEIFEDKSHAEGGHVVIRLNGLMVRPDNDAFLIEPVDDVPGASPPQGWPSGERTPLVTRMSDKGLEIVAGPDVVESPVLLPGTPVVVKVPGANVSHEVLWPTITPLRRQKVRRIVTSSDRAQAMGAGASAAAASLAKRANGSIGRDSRALSSLNAEGGRGSSRNSGATHSMPTPTAGALFSSPPAAAAGRTAASDAVNSATSAPLASASGMPKSTTGGMAAQSAAAGGTQVSNTIGNRAGAGDLGGKAVAVKSMDWQGQPRDRSARRFATMALTLAALAAGTSLFSHFARVGWPGGDNAAAVAEKTALPPVAQVASLYDALRVSETSPRGANATRASAAAALKEADRFMYGEGGKRDASEGAFWLKQYLAKQFSDQQTLWALTQLGSAYAQPDGKAPDYGKARMLWETAAALGDPVAACFLGGLYEFGLGVGASKYEALKWYLRAKDAGGCPSLEAAIKRTRD